MKTKFDGLAATGDNPQETYDQKRAELAKRKANLSRQHELGLIDDLQLIARLSEIRQEESLLRVPSTASISLRWEGALQVMRTLESLGSQWKEASDAGEHVLCHQMAFVLVERAYLDLLQSRIVGLRPKADLYLPMKHRLQQFGWYEREPGVLWNDEPLEFPTRVKRTHYEDVVESLQAGMTITLAIAEHLGIHYNNVHRVLRRMLHEGEVESEQIPDAGRKHLKFRYLGPRQPQGVEPKLRPGAPSPHQE